MATEKLIVELQGKTDDLEKDLTAIAKKLDDLEGGAGKADSSLSKLGGVAKITGSTLKTVAVAGIAAATALTAVVVASAKSQRELEQLSAQAKLTTDDFESLTFATEQYGVSSEQVADISKDLSDKLGEYSKVGTGAFQDYADVMNLTTEEAKILAGEFENMSSDQVIGQMVSSMEEAGATGNQMTFVLESMGSDLSKLTPLFKNNSKELNTLRQRYTDATKALQLTSEQAKDLQQTATDFDLAMDVMTKSGTAVVSKLAPALSSFFNGVIDVVPDATQSVINFINSFLKAEEIKSIAELNVQIKEAKEKTEELTAERDKWLNSESNMKRAQNAAKNSVASLNEQIAEQTQRTKELTEQKEKLAAQELADVERLKGGDITATGGTGENNTGGTGDEIAALEDRFKTEAQLLEDKYNKEVALAGENKKLLLNLEEEYQENLAAITDAERAKAETEYMDAVNAIASQEDLRNIALEKEIDEINAAAEHLKEIKDAQYEQGILDEQEYQDQLAAIRKAAAAKTAAATSAVVEGNEDKTASEEDYLNAAMTASSALSSQSEAAAYASVIASTAAGIARQFDDLPIYLAIPSAIAVAAAGAAQLASIGSGSLASSSTSVSTAADSDAESDIYVSNNDANNSTQNVVVSFDESGTLGELGVFLNSAITQASQDGLT